MPPVQPMIYAYILGNIWKHTHQKLQESEISDDFNSIYSNMDGPREYSCLENPVDGGAWWAAVHGVAKSRTGLSDFTFTFHFHALGKETPTHSSVLAWRIPGMGEPGGLPSMGLHRVGQDWNDLAAAAAAAVLFTVATSGSKPKCPSTDEWKDKMCLNAEWIEWYWNYISVKLF